MSKTKPLILFLCCFALFACKQNTPNMDPKGNNFFDMPWPSDLRIENEVVDLSKFPARVLNPLARNLSDQGIKTINGFGTNSAVYFSFGIDLDTSTLPSPEDSLRADANVMLINIDPDSESFGIRTPVAVDFESNGTLYRQSKLLALLPRVGFTLDEKTEYAAIIFNGIKNADGDSIEASPLLARLDRAWDKTTGLSEQAFNVLAAQKESVLQYVSSETQWNAEDVVAFTVFTTQGATDTAMQLADTVLSLPEEEVVGSVRSLSISNTCDCLTCGDSAILRGTIDLPRWQSGEGPYLFVGGGIQFDDYGNAIMNHQETVPFEINFACLPTPANGNPYNVDAGGSGSLAGDSELRWISDQEFNLTTISVGAYQTGERVDPGLDDAIELLNTLGIPIPEVDLEGAIFYNYFNPLTAAHNKLQAASEFVFLKRVLENLEKVASAHNIQTSNLGLDENAFKVDRNKAGIWGFSQGASSVPIALAMDPTFNFAVLNSPSSITFPPMLDWKPINDLINAILVGLQPDELTRFHPVVQMIQMFHEVGDSTNYVPYINVKNILITAGCYDIRVPREAAEALGVALARAGLLDIANTSCATAPFGPVNPSISTGVALMNKDLIELPFDYSNRYDGGTGVFILSEDGHGTHTSRFIGGDFAYGIVNDIPPFISNP